MIYKNNLTLLLFWLLLWLVESSEWKRVQVDSRLPPSRSGHSLTNFNATLVLFGGCELEKVCYNDVYVYEPRLNIWSQVEITGNPPTARRGHSATLLGNLLYIIAGTSLNGMLNDVWILDMQNWTWTEMQVEGRIDARSYHKAVLSKEGIILIFGGNTKYGISDEVVLLDTINNHWGYPSTSGKEPGPRMYHSLDVIKGQIWLFGGIGTKGPVNEMHYLDFDIMRWYEIYPDTSPLPRYGHATAVSGSHLYLTAGCNSEIHKCYDDLYRFDVSNETWTREEMEGKFHARESHDMEFLLGDMYVIGGQFFLDYSYGEFLSADIGELCPDECSDHGECTTRGCKCDEGFSGSDCSIEAVCRNECSQHGFCKSDFKCECYWGYRGESCQIYVNCPNNCTDIEHGRCLATGDCLCYEGYIGDDCALMELKKLCQTKCRNGSCTSSGSCECYSGWIGNNCDIEAPIIYSSNKYDIEINPHKKESSKFTGNFTHPNKEGMYYDEDLGYYIPLEPSSSPSRHPSASPEVDSQAYSLESVSNITYQVATEGQDQAADNVKSDNSSHTVSSEMFGYSTGRSTYAASNLRRMTTSEEEQVSEYDMQIQDKQQDRQDEIDKCANHCFYHGVCYDGKCYCEDGYTGTECEQEEDEIDKGVRISNAMIVMICFIGNL
jgi:N-acetylneuraminic acid mutarotase